MNEFLQSQGIEIVKGKVFCVDRVFIKDWIPTTVPFEVVGGNARFFKWASPTTKEFYTVPISILFEVNPAPIGCSTPLGYPTYPRPDGPIPEGKKLVWDPTMAGAMRLVDINEDTRTDIQKLQDSSDNIEKTLQDLVKVWKGIYERLVGTSSEEGGK